MTVLFDRDWRVIIDREAYTGHAVAFEVEKTKKREPNSVSVQIWNLSEIQRAAIQALSLKKRATGAQTGGRIRVEIEAGYLGSRSLLFRGDLRTAQSVRDGADWITTVEGEDGGRSILSSRINQGFPPGTSVATVVKACARAMGLGLGNVEALAAAARTRGGSTFANGTALSGKADQELTGLLLSCGLTWSVQNGNLQVLKAGAALSTTIYRLTGATGLINAPVANPDGTVEAACLLVPGLFPGGRVQLDSATVKGTYTIQKLKSVGQSDGADWGHTMELK